MKKRRIISAILCICMVAAALGLSGCGNNGGGNRENVTVSWYLPVGTRNDDVAVYEKVNEYVKEKLGFNVAINCVNSGNYEQKMQVMNAGGDKYDICFTSNWLNNYYTAVQNEILMPLDDLLKEEAPALYTLFDEKMWDGVRCDGKIYGVMNQQIFARGPALIMPKKNLDNLGFTLDDFNKLEDLTPYLRAVKEKTGTRPVAFSDWQSLVQFYGLEEILGSGMPGAIYYNDKNLKVVNQFETEEFKGFINTIRQWVKEGINHEEIIWEWGSAVADKDKPVTSQAFTTPATYKPGYVESLSASYETEMVYKRIANPLLTSYGVTATMQSINANSENSVEAIKLLELVNTDARLFNLLTHGIEGRNYEMIGENRIKVSAENPYSPADWAIGNTFIGYELSSDPENVYTITKEINDTATMSPAYGFYPDMSEFAVQTSNCKAVIGEYLQGLEQGVVDTEKLYPEFISKLKAAGVDEIIDELQRQIDEWAKNR